MSNLKRKLESPTLDKHEHERNGPSSPEELTAQNILRSGRLFTIALRKWTKRPEAWLRWKKSLRTKWEEHATGRVRQLVCQTAALIRMTSERKTVREKDVNDGYTLLQLSEPPCVATALPAVPPLFEHVRIAQIKHCVFFWCPHLVNQCRFTRGALPRFISILEPEFHHYLYNVERQQWPNLCRSVFDVCVDDSQCSMPQPLAKLILSYLAPDPISLNE